MSQRQTHGGFGHQQYHSSRVPREIQEVEGGHYDSHGFYNLPGGGKYSNCTLTPYVLDLWIFNHIGKYLYLSL